MGDVTSRQELPQNLMDLLGLNASGSARQSPMTQQVPAAAMASNDTFSSPREQQLYEMLTKPQDQGPAPTVEKKSTAGSIFKMLGDAVSTYASIMGRNPNLETHSFQKYLATLEKQKSDLKDYESKTAEAKQAAALRGAQFLMTEQDRKQIRDDAQQGRLDLQKNILDERKAQAAALALREQADRDEKRDAFDAKKKWDVEMETTRYKHDEAIAGIRAKAASGDDVAKNDQKKVGEIMTHIGGLADVARVALAGGDPAQQIPAMTPEQMNTRVRRLIDASQVSPEARKALEHYYDVEMGPTLRDYQIEQRNQELGAQGPQQAAPNIWDKLGIGPKSFGK